MLKELRKSFMCTRIESSCLERITPKSIKANLTIATALSTFATVLITAILILSFLSRRIHQNKNVYVVGLVVSLVISVISLVVVRKSLKLAQQTQRTSRIDQLTQMRNRNAYELEKESILDICKHTIAVIYIDVNGLHEVNNEKGHEYGDKMLKNIAKEVKSAFSEELTYRIGGDEFVAFVPDENKEELESSLQEMIKKIEAKSYHIAVGFEIAKIKHVSLENVINQAEKNMLNNKSDFYKNIINRKSRNETT